MFILTYSGYEKRLRREEEKPFIQEVKQEAQNVVPWNRTEDVKVNYDHLSIQNDVLTLFNFQNFNEMCLVYKYWVCGLQIYCILEAGDINQSLYYVYRSPYHSIYVLLLIAWTYE